MLSSEVKKKKTSEISKEHKASTNKTKNGTAAKKVVKKKVATTKNKTAATKKTKKKSAPTPAVVKKDDPTEMSGDSLSQLDSIDQKLGSATKMTEE